MEPSFSPARTRYEPVYLLAKTGQLSVLNTGVGIPKGTISFEISTPWIWSQCKGGTDYKTGNSIKLSSVQLALNKDAQTLALASPVYKSLQATICGKKPFYLGMVFKDEATISPNSFPPPLESPYVNTSDIDVYETKNINSYIVRDFLVEALLDLPGQSGSTIDSDTWTPVIMRVTIGGKVEAQTSKPNSLQLDFYGFSKDAKREFINAFPTQASRIELNELLSTERAYINPYVNNQYVWTKIDEDLPVTANFTDSKQNQVSTGTMYPPGNLECIMAALDTTTNPPGSGNAEDGLNWKTQIEASNPARPYNKPGYAGGKPVLKDEFLHGDVAAQTNQIHNYVNSGEIPRVEVYGFRPMSQNPNPTNPGDGICPPIKIDYEIGTDAKRPINGFPRESAPDITLDKTAADSEGKIYYLPTTTAKVGSAAADGDAFVYYSISDKVAFSGEYFNFIESTIYPGGQRGWNGDYPGTQNPAQGVSVPGWAKPVPSGTNGGIDPPWTIPDVDPNKVGYFSDYIPPNPPVVAVTQTPAVG
jgi:hypothetical protein